MTEAPQFGQLSRAIDADADGTRADAAQLTENGRPTAKGRGFVFDDDLVAAVDVALVLGRPLLVAGEPGCGKTELGYAVARHLGIGRVHLAVVKSNSEAGDLFYTYDALRRFRDEQIKATRKEEAAPGSLGDYIDFQALGTAILDAHERDAVAHLLLGKHGRERLDDPRPRRSMVVIDEIDKAPRDFPNDLLHEIEAMSFRVREYESFPVPETPPADQIAPGMRPIVIVTSNEERQLPDAFLRRCIFHEIGFPNPDRLLKILRNGLGHRLARMHRAAAPLDDPRARRLVRLLTQFRDASPDKKPGIAELLDAAALLSQAPGDAPLTLAKPALAKLKADRELFDEVAR